VPAVEGDLVAKRELAPLGAGRGRLPTAMHGHGMNVHIELQVEHHTRSSANDGDDLDHR
jgi:hypothetical protein